MEVLHWELTGLVAAAVELTRFLSTQGELAADRLLVDRDKLERRDDNC